MIILPALVPVLVPALVPVLVPGLAPVSVRELVQNRHQEEAFHLRRRFRLDSRHLDFRCLDFHRLDFRHPGFHRLDSLYLLSLHRRRRHSRHVLGILRLVRFPQRKIL